MAAGCAKATAPQPRHHCAAKLQAGADSRPGGHLSITGKEWSMKIKRLPKIHVSRPSFWVLTAKLRIFFLPDPAFKIDAVRIRTLISVVDTTLLNLDPDPEIWTSVKIYLFFEKLNNIGR